jgi:hypothetical protein
MGIPEGVNKCPRPGFQTSAETFLGGLAFFGDTILSISWLVLESGKERMYTQVEAESMRNPILTSPKTFHADLFCKPAGASDRKTQVRIGPESNFWC